MAKPAAGEKYDVIVIGAGPAGYVCAIRCAQLGLKTACIDDWSTPSGAPVLGGTCLNAGCIPSKALLEASEKFAELRDHGARFGVRAGDLSFDLASMMAHKQKVVADLTRGIAGLFKANGITAVHGHGRLLNNRRVEVMQPDGQRILEAGHVVLASGSVPMTIPAAPVDGRHIVDSAGALSFDRVPGRLGIVGAGVIGLELGSVWRRLGAEVVLFEAQDRFLSIADEAVAREAQKQFGAQGLDIRIGARVLSTRVEGDAVVVAVEDTAGKREERVDRLIVAVGRRPNARDLAAEDTGLLIEEWGVIHVDEHCRTNLPGVHAIGDVVRGPMLAHKGSEEGVMVAERIAGGKSEINHDLIPSVIYTRPEIAWVGKTEAQLKAAGTAYRVGQFPFAASGRALAKGETAGFVKILAAEGTDRVLGVHIIGPQASELISGAVLAMAFGASSEDLALTVFAHPTLAEAMHEAALAVHGRALHIGRPRKP
ncbi:MAG: dihydrolipoyl dehydrogenase [Candidatus Muproteobacteria bacterium RBG_16_62_13]|uniref:Dihydrolipoyl dehydrogenase n=1 Tax=Candidatus Muproteobacteria bacterium RBG_16_62_13 TaxID=1817756 RepID=A0A1F6T7U1_9PROT|nr:MAG: dihydrolipoyl dehydrogenase [Candidatus Muproteobacteria bacterium RBG_16_62_13]